MENFDHIHESMENDYYSWLNDGESKPTLLTLPTLPATSIVIPIQLTNSKHINNVMLTASINAMTHEMNLLQAKINFLMCIMKTNNMN